MNTLLSILTKTTEYFKQKDIASPRLNAECLIAHALHVSRMDLYLQFDRPMADEELKTLRELVKRRADRYPLQYLTGKAYFRELEITVKPGILIPRPETELLVETVIKRIHLMNQPTVFEMGTGSGCIALSLVKELRQCRVTASDISGEAIAFAEENMARLEIDFSRLKWMAADGLAHVQNKFDAFVSNPPYIPSGDIDSLQVELRYEPRQALDGGTDGLNFYRSFVTDVPRVLKPGGWIFLEIGFDQQKPVEKLFSDSGKWKDIKTYPDLAGIPRVFEARLKD